MKFGDFLKKEIFDPLGMADTTFDFENADKSRFATLTTSVRTSIFPLRSDVLIFWAKTTRAAAQV